MRSLILLLLLSLFPVSCGKSGGKSDTDSCECECEDCECEEGKPCECQDCDCDCEGESDAETGNDHGDGGDDGCGGGGCKPPPRGGLKAMALSACLLSSCVTPQAALVDPIEFSLPNYMNGQRVLNSSSYDGRKMVIEFYFNGCPACNSNAHNFRTMYNQHNAHAQFLEVSIDCDADDYSDWTSSHGPSWPVLMDCDRVLAEGPLNVGSYPTTVVVDESHRVIYRTSGIWNSSKKRAIARAIMQ